MSFISLMFGLFFSIVAILYYCLPARVRWMWLLVVSVVFYMWRAPATVLIPLFIILISYLGGIQIENSDSERQKRNFFLLSILANVGVLAFFKYSNFFTGLTFDCVNFVIVRVFHSAEALENPLLLAIAAPLGISYITFQAMGYLIEIRRGNHQAEKNIGVFSTYIMFFPKLMAGPVERAHNFLPQLKQSFNFDYDGVTVGLRLVAWGLFKKLVIADRLSIFINAVFQNVPDANSTALLIACFFNTIQIFADFSGYTDMAIGLAKILGFDLMQNFDRPLLAHSVTEFWRRWHISLSSWFTDYVYTPIVIERRNWGTWGVIYALLCTFVIIGLWHGATLNFVVFGLLQGIMLSIEFLTNKTRKRIPEVLKNYLGIAFTFSFISFTVIFFKAHTIAEALTIVGRIISDFSFSAPNLHSSSFGWRPRDYAIILFSIPFMEFVHQKLHSEHFWAAFAKKPLHVRWGIYYAALFIIVFFGVHETRQFIYFQF
jgi:D-alanyl-lipoteichoic acid acyltransferase DltB (MBOAT superfamily)